MNEGGAFCKTYGCTISNRVLEYMLENQDMDFAVSDMAKEIEISKPKAYEIIDNYEKKGYIQKSRLVGKTQLFILNKNNRRVKLFLSDFKECLKIVADEYSEVSFDSEVNKSNSENCILARVFLGKVDITEKLLEAF